MSDRDTAGTTDRTAGPERLARGCADCKPRTVDILIPTAGRPAALAVTLTSLAAQTFGDARIVISDQTEDGSRHGGWTELKAVLRVLEARGFAPELHVHLPRRGLAEQRQFLLDTATAPYALFLDDDVILEPDLLERLVRAIRRERCGFVGSALIGLSFVDDERPHEQAIDFWEGPVEPEHVFPGGFAWERAKLHNAANIYHLQRRLGLSPEKERLYHVAWVGGCVLYDTAALRAVGGFGFWRDLPTTHSGEDVLAQLRVMARNGGAGLIPSGAYHQELPTTVRDRRIDAPKVLRISPDNTSSELAATSASETSATNEAR